MKKIFLIFLLFFIFLLSFFVKKTVNLPGSTESSQITGWIAYWDKEKSKEIVETNGKNINTLSPIFFMINENGNGIKDTGMDKQYYLKKARELNVKLLPVIGDEFDRVRVEKVLFEKRSQDMFIDSLIKEAETNKYSGYAIDVETLEANDEEAFTNFVKNTSETLKINGLELNVILFAKEETERYIPAVVQNYQEIGRYADKVSLMAYGYHNESTAPGAQAPESWYREVLRYSTEQIPKDKLEIGLSTHGYLWGGEIAEPLTFPEIKKIEGYNSSMVKYNQSSAILEMEREGEKYELWFENAKTVQEKIEIARNEFGINKFAIWRIGAEDPTIWNYLENSSVRE